MPKMFEKFQRYIISSTIDEKWREHLYAMDQLREGIGLRAYGQKNPLIEYKKEGFSMFDQMISDIDQNILKKIFRTNIADQIVKKLKINTNPKFVVRSLNNKFSESLINKKLNTTKKEKN